MNLKQYLDQLQQRKDEMKYAVAGRVKQVNDDGSIRFHLITDGLDRDSEVLLPRGAQLDNYTTNPVWLWAHNYRQPSIGKALPDSFEITDTYFALDVVFDESNDEFAKLIAEKHRNGFLNASSVGFIPQGWDETPHQEGQRGYTFTKYDVMEGSSVPVPANPGALQQLDASEWYDWVKVLEKHGVKAEEAAAWMLDAGWTKYEIQDALPSGKTQVNVPEDVEADDRTDKFLGEPLDEAVARLERIADGGKGSDPELVQAMIDTVKQFQHKKVVPYHQFTKAAKDADWSFTAEDGNALLGANGDSWSQYRSVHSWYDAENPVAKSSYKLPVAKLADGTIKVYWRGVVAAMAALMGARGGADIPDADRRGVYNRLVKYYQDFDEAPPEFNSAAGMQFDMVRNPDTGEITYKNFSVKPEAVGELLKLFGGTSIAQQCAEDILGKMYSNIDLLKDVLEHIPSLRSQQAWSNRVDAMAEKLVELNTIDEADRLVASIQDLTAQFRSLNNIQVHTDESETPEPAEPPSGSTDDVSSILALIQETTEQLKQE